MESFRKWFYRPKKDDRSLLAQFFFADEALNMITNELDSFDGRKDPERCTSLVNQMRQCQDKVLTITSAIMDVLIGDERANRDFRVKFPDDVLQENLAGQLWFGAECLAAGSSIMNREAESTEMRPLAKAVTRSLENVRNLLRDACLRNNTPNGPIKLDTKELFSDLLIENLKMFDHLFAGFEFAYVSAMVPVKTRQEYELQELIGVLFSETLQRALKMKLLTQEMVDSCDPALMFTIPRLGIVSGLLIYPNGPLCIDKPYEEMSEMFRPFRVLLHRIRDLLWTLNKRELYMLEKLLCDNEQISDVKSVGELNVSDIDELINRFYDDYALCKDYISNSSPTAVDLPSTSRAVFKLNGDSQESLVDEEEEAISVAAATLSSLLIESDSKSSYKEKIRTRSSESPDDSGVCTENTSLDRSPILDVNREMSPIAARSSNSKVRQPARKKTRALGEEDDLSIGSSDTSSFNSNCADDEEIALAMQAAEFADRNKARAMYRNSEDLIHRLFVCIAGVADQLQTNFASDLRNILKAVFLMNASSDTNDAETVIATSSLDVSIEYHPSEDEVIENNEFSVDPNILAQEALFDTNVYFALEEQETNNRSATNSPTAIHHPYTNHPRQSLRRSSVATVSELAADLERLRASEASTVERPPVWIPDVEAPRCMSCGANFTVVKRRHHCRNCGKVFCSRCSSNSVPLPRFGHVKPVRVCNKCFMYHLTPFTV